MGIIEPNIILPEVKLEYIMEDQEKKFRVVSEPLDPITMNLLKNQQLRIQVWIERELKKASGELLKRSWVHSIDMTKNAPKKLFDKYEYHYGGGLGWGFKTMDELPPYSTTNGYAPTEFEISPEDILDNRIIKRINIMDIFTNIIKRSGISCYPLTGDEMEFLAILGRNKSKSQPIRVRLMGNYQKKVYKSLPSNAVVLGIHQDGNVKIFNEDNIRQYIRVSYYK